MKNKEWFHIAELDALLQVTDCFSTYEISNQITGKTIVKIYFNFMNKMYCANFLYDLNLLYNYFFGNGADIFVQSETDQLSAPMVIVAEFPIEFTKGYAAAHELA